MGALAILCCATHEWYEVRPSGVPRSACPTVPWAVSAQGIALSSRHSCQAPHAAACRRRAHACSGIMSVRIPRDRALRSRVLPIEPPLR
jgi:hypothetical protein